jgi:hypothetical protein
MTRYQTAEEVRAEYIALMGEDIGMVFNALWQEVAWLHMKWSENVVLFETKPSRIDLMNKAAQRFFWMIQDSLWKDIILHIARLTDPSKSAGKDNLTIQKLPYLISDQNLKNNVKSLIESSLEATVFCRDWRNRLIAHCDLDLAIDNVAKELEPASRKSIQDAITSIVNVLNAVSLHYQDAETAFEVLAGPGGGVSLLHLIDSGLRAEAERLERLNESEYNEEDFRVRDI